MKDYLSVKERTETIKIIEKSKFITQSAHVAGEEEARAFIAEVAKNHSAATHNCFAFVGDELGNLLRFSDDGEPQGTAGMPILEAIRGKNLMCTAVVVTRYFGGIKLGAGGLIRAYSGCASENLQAAKKVIYTICSKLVCRVDYSAVDNILRFFSSFDCNVIGREYLDRVTFTVAVKERDEERFVFELNDFLMRKVEIEKVASYLSPFDV